MNSGLYEFIGRDGSMGLRKGENYELYINELSEGFIDSFFNWMLGKTWKIEAYIYVDDYEKPIWCPYDTRAAFLKNWRPVSGADNQVCSRSDMNLGF